MWKNSFKLLSITLLLSSIIASISGYQIGVGIADCTGPAAGVNFMGYAQLAQKGAGIHLRQFARAFIIGDGTKRVAFVSVDVGMIGYGLREAVIENLSKVYGDTYNIQNVIISGTHTHGTPGGFMQHFMFDVTVLGFVKQTYDGYVEGITRAITKAHENIVNGKVILNNGILLDSNINRSPASYLQNPESERSQYDYNVDKDMYQLKFVDNSDNILGLINWFPVHPVSMNNTNHLITSDNVGYAALLMEKHLNNNAFPGEGKIVSAFASTNLGDVSPNTKGPICIDTGLPCDEVASSCGGTVTNCIASGPGEDMFESTEIIATNMYTKALELMSGANAREVTGSVNVIHQFVDMPSQTAQYTLGDGSTITGKGCNSAMGYSFAAGTTDGPGEFDFVQGMTGEGTSLWNMVRSILAKPSQEDIDCHAPKPILLATGQMKDPYEWQPKIVSTQLAMIGNVAIAAVPGEFTTMAGRRLKNVIKNVMTTNGAGAESTVILAGLSNHYTDYITTYEEYQLQRYEGASTVYGPHTHGIYLSQYQKLATALLNGGSLDSGPTPHSFDTSKLLSLVAPVLLDTPDLDNDFGTCKTQPAKTASIGDTVSAVFVAGHPRNDLKHGSTFLTVERQDGDYWTVVANDAMWETKFKWERTYLATQEVTIEWTIPEGTSPGTYRIRHFGKSKSLFAAPVEYIGVSNTFQVA
ncbi:neutral ceramidase [Onthophagus taurus]|uniref:neutral ceramidase n=1 Tax=Onthophagus taurus TaxID=166361 RepID=UPI000C2065F8|nr:neutral ceramidase [Onthophagus taurus]